MYILNVSVYQQGTVTHYLILKNINNLIRKKKKIISGGEISSLICFKDWILDIHNIIP